MLSAIIQRHLGMSALFISKVQNYGSKVRKLEKKGNRVENGLLVAVLKHKSYKSLQKSFHKRKVNKPFVKALL